MPLHSSDGTVRCDIFVLQLQGPGVDTRVDGQVIHCRIPLICSRMHGMRQCAAGRAARRRTATTVTRHSAVTRQGISKMVRYFSIYFGGHVTLRHVV